MDYRALHGEIELRLEKQDLPVFNYPVMISAGDIIFIMTDGQVFDFILRQNGQLINTGGEEEPIGDEFFNVYVNAILPAEQNVTDPASPAEGSIKPVPNFLNKNGDSNQTLLTEAEDAGMSKRLKIGRGVERCLRVLYRNDEGEAGKTLENIHKFLKFEFAPKDRILDGVDRLSDDAKVQMLRELIKDKEIAAESFASRLTLEQLLLFEESPDTDSLSYVLGRFFVQFAHEKDFKELYEPVYRGKPDALRYDEKRWKTAYLLLWAAEILAANSDKKKGNIANCIKDMHKHAKPATMTELVDEICHRPRRTVQDELDMLDQLGLRVREGEGKRKNPYKYSLHPMLRGLTGAQINSICEMKIELNGKLIEPLDRWRLDSDVIPRVQAEIIKAIQNIIHKENAKFTPAIPKGVLWHVFDGLIPEIQQKTGSFVTQLERSEGSERIRVVKEKEKLKDVLEELLQDPNNIVHVIVNDETKLDEVLPEGETAPDNVRAAILKGELGNYAQVEGAMAVSRTLAIKNRRLRNTRLRRLHRILTGEPFRGKIPDTDDPRTLALAIIFNLPEITVHPTELQNLNKNLILLIQSL